MKARSLNQLKREALKNDDIRREYEALQAEYGLVDALLTAREQSNMTQEELSEKSGVPQADISRIESGKANPTLRTLGRIAEAMGRKVEIRFV